MFGYFDKIMSNNTMMLNRDKINMNRYDNASYLYIHIFMVPYFSYFLYFLLFLLFSLVSLISLVYHTPSCPPYTPASYSQGIAFLAGSLTNVSAVNT